MQSNYCSYRLEAGVSREGGSGHGTFPSYLYGKTFYHTSILAEPQCAYRIFEDIKISRHACADGSGGLCIELECSCQRSTTYSV